MNTKNITIAGGVVIIGFSTRALLKQREKDRPEMLVPAIGILIGVCTIVYGAKLETIK